MSKPAQAGLPVKPILMRLKFKGENTMTIVEITGKAREYREVQAMIKQLEEEAEALKGEMIAELEAQGVRRKHTASRYLYYQVGGIQEQQG